MHVDWMDVHGFSGRIVLPTTFLFAGLTNVDFFIIVRTKNEQMNKWHGFKNIQQKEKEL